MHYVYILKCSNGRLYVGCTNNLKDRIIRHTRKEVLATRDILLVKLIFYCSFLDRGLAYRFEKYLKSGSGRAFISSHLV